MNVCAHLYMQVHTWLYMENAFPTVGDNPITLDKTVLERILGRNKIIFRFYIHRYNLFYNQVIPQIKMKFQKCLFYTFIYAKNCLNGSAFKN
jgi:hypothetical protein